MTTAAIVIAWIGYAMASYGYLLIRGYDVTWQSWIDPLHPYTGSYSAGSIPSSQVLP